VVEVRKADPPSAVGGLEGIDKRVGICLSKITFDQSFLPAVFSALDFPSQATANA